MKKTTIRFLAKRGKAALLGAFGLSLGLAFKIIPAIWGGEIEFIEASKGFVLTMLVGGVVGFAYSIYRPILRKLGRHLGDALTGAISIMILCLSIYYLVNLIDPGEWQPDSLSQITVFMGIIGAVGGWIMNITKAEIDFIESVNDEVVYECYRHFEPLGTEIELGVAGDEKRLQPAQKQFFELIESNYSKITHTIAPLIEEKFKNSKEGFRINDFETELKPVYIFLPECQTKPVLWGITFETDHDLSHYFMISMKDMKALEVLTDGNSFMP